MRGGSDEDGISDEDGCSEEEGVSEDTGSSLELISDDEDGSLLAGSAIGTGGV